MKKLAFLALLIPLSGLAQGPSNPSVIPVQTAPLVCAGPLPLFTQYSTGDVWSCNNGTPNLLSNASGGDSITSPNSTITVGGTATATTLDIALGHANTWTANQTSAKWIASTGFDISGATTAGHYLRNNGTDFVDSLIQAGDLPTGIPIANVGSAGLSGVAPITISLGGAIGCSTCLTSSGISGMTASQVAIAATATTIASSKALAGSGSAITTGPTTSTNGDCVEFTGTAGQIADNGSACGSGGGISFPQTVAGTTASGGVPYFSNTTTLTSSALLATNALVVGGGAGGAPATGNGDFTYATHTLTGSSSGLVVLAATNALTLSAMSGTACLEEVSGVVTSTGSACGSGGGIAFPQTVSGTTTSGGLVYLSSATQISSSGAGTTNAPVLWGGAGTAPTAGHATDNGTVWAFTEGMTISPSATTQVGLIVNNPSSTSVNIADFENNGTIEAFISNTGSLSLGSSAPTACGSASGCWAAAEASTAGTPTSGDDYIRASSSTHQYVLSLNDSAEFVSLMNFAGDGSTLTESGTTLSCTTATSSQIGCAKFGSGLTVTTGNVTVNGAAGEILAGATPALTATPALGTDGSVAGTVQLSNSAASAHTILGSVATTSNTVDFFATAPTTGDLVDCVTSGTTCTLTDSGVLASGVVTSAASLTNNALMTGAGSQGAQTITTGTGVVTALGDAANGSGGFLTQPGAAQYDVLYSGGTTSAVVGAAINGIQQDSTTGAPAAATGHQVQVPLYCPDTSGSGTAQSCSTGGTTYTPAAGDYIVYTTTTTNSGTGLTVNVNSLGAKSIAIPGASGYTTTLTASIIPANKPQLLMYDGTNWDDQQTGTAAGGSSALSGLTNATATNTLANGNNPQVWGFAQTTNAQTAFLFDDTAAATGTTDVLLGVTTAASSTETPLVVAEGAQTGTTAPPAVKITASYNNSSLNATPFIEAVTETSTSSDTYFEILGGSAGTTAEFSLVGGGAMEWNGPITETTAGDNMAIFAGNNLNGIVSSSSLAGGMQLGGASNSNTGSGAQAGFTVVSGGLLTAGTPNAAALEGVVQIQEGYLKGTAIAAVGDVVCGTTTAFTVTDCPITPGTNIIGIANKTANPIGVVSYGTALVSLDGALTAIGDNVCASTTTAGKAHDNGSATTACTLGASIGVIIADSGSITIQTGTTQTSTAMSTTLVLVQLHIGQ